MLIRMSFRESDTKQPQNVSVGRFRVHVSFDQRLPFLDQRAQFISREIHSVKIRKTIFSLDVLANQTKFTEIVLVIIQIAQRRLENSTLQTFRRDSCALRSINDRLTDVAIGEHRRSFYGVPFFARKRIDGLLFATFFARFRQSFVFTDGHYELFFFYL